MTDFKVKIGSKEAVLDVQVIVLPLLNLNLINLVRILALKERYKKYRTIYVAPFRYALETLGE